MNGTLRCGLGAVALAGIALLLGNSLSAGDKVDLKVGDKAPEFTSVDDQGKPWKSTDHVGKKVVVVYFYPADLTGGCTKQACGFRDDSEKLKAKGVEVVGVSGDSVENHKLFKKEMKLDFTLLADEKGDVAKKFGVPVSKGGVFKYKAADGTVTPLTRGVSTARVTFVIAPDGTIASREAVKDAGGDSKRIMEVVEKLKK